MPQNLVVDGGPIHVLGSSQSLVVHQSGPIGPPGISSGDVVVSAVEPPAPQGPGAPKIWVRTPGNLRAFMDFRNCPDGPIPDLTNGSNPEDPAVLGSFHEFGAPFQPCLVIDGAVQSDMVTPSNPSADPPDMSTRTGFAILIQPNEVCRVEWGFDGYAVPDDDLLDLYVTSNVSVASMDGNAYLFDIVTGKLDPLTGELDPERPVSCGFRLIRDDFIAPTSIGWAPLDRRPVPKDRFGFVIDGSNNELTGLFNGEPVVTAVDAVHDHTTFTSVGMPLHQDLEQAYFVRVAWLGVSDGDPINPDALGVYYWTGSRWRYNSALVAP